MELHQKNTILKWWVNEVEMIRLLCERIQITKEISGIPGLVGVAVSIIIGILFSWQGLYYVRCLENYLHDLPLPEYLPINQFMGLFVFVIPAFIGFILIWILWDIFGSQLKIVACRRRWNRSQISLAWLAWGTISVPLLFSIIHIVFFIMVDILDGRRIRLDDIIEFTYEYTIWWIFSGLMGGLVSAIYSAIRWSNDMQEG